MSTDNKTKICRDCKMSKPTTDYYKRSANTYRSQCKPCCNVIRKQYITNSNYIPRGKKKNAFEKMNPELQSSIKADMKTITLKEVSIKYGIKYTTLHTWKRNGYLI